MLRGPEHATGALHENQVTTKTYTIGRGVDSGLESVSNGNRRTAEGKVGANAVELVG